jgi:predicted metal-dependent hydrolase
MPPADVPIPPTERPEFALAMRLHNDGEFYEAHEAWEQIWVNELDDDWRLFVQGLIQVTSAFHKLFVQREPGGASRLLERGLDKLDKYPPDYLGLALGRFREGARACVPHLADLAPKSPAIDRFDRALVPPLRPLSRSPSDPRS